MPSCWRDDAPQAICTSEHNCLHGTFSKASCILSRAHSVAFAWTLKMFFVFFPISSFQRKGGLFHHSGSAISVSTTLYLFQVYLGRRFALPLALYPFLLFFLGLSKPLCFQSLTRKILPFIVCTGLLPAFSITFHGAPFSPRPRTTATSSRVHLLLSPDSRCSIAGTSLACRIPNPALSLPTQTARNGGLFHCTDCHTETWALVEC